MIFGPVVSIVVSVLLVGVMPTCPCSRDRGWLSSKGLGLVVIVVIAPLLMGRP